MPGAEPSEAFSSSCCPCEWFVVRTRSRQERLLARDLTAMGLVHFVPLLTVSRTYAGRRGEVLTPLFPGYVFLRGGESAAAAAARTGRVTEVTSPGRDGEKSRALDRQLCEIDRALASGAALEPHRFLPKGTPAEVRDGPFAGLRGVVERHASATRLILQVDVLGRAVALEINPESVHVIEPDDRPAQAHGRIDAGTAGID